MGNWEFKYPEDIVKNLKKVSHAIYGLGRINPDEVEIDYYYSTQYSPPGGYNLEVDIDVKEFICDECRFDYQEIGRLITEWAKKIETPFNHFGLGSRCKLDANKKENFMGVTINSVNFSGNEFALSFSLLFESYAD